jgi:hypothetical protein
MTVSEYCKLKQRSNTTLELIKKLKQFSADDDYILGILADSEFDEDRKLIIDFIDKGENVDYESVILFSLEVGQQRDRLLNR